MKMKMFQVDAFAEEMFSGNPAAVCLPGQWPDDDLMQKIAAENNLSETAFVVKQEQHFQIRWFTPQVEVDLCGHATLASAYVLLHHTNYGLEEVHFVSPRSGNLMVSEKEGILYLDFPADTLDPCDCIERIARCIGVKPLQTWKGKTDIIALLESEQQIKDLAPDFAAIAGLPARGLIVTAPGDEVDFVSRFFCPQLGIDEDPVTGSAHTSLTPFWSEKLGKKQMQARQLSQRGGNLSCFLVGQRILIGGKARLYMEGMIETQ
ncbi:MAG: PhzF family phenazine biosynthesis protein [Bacteroidales bacterium]